MPRGVGRGKAPMVDRLPRRRRGVRENPPRRMILSRAKSLFNKTAARVGIYREFNMAKVFLICGKICCGKSEYAKRLRAEQGGVVLSVDEIMLAVFGPYTGEMHDTYTARLQEYLFEKSVDITAVGTNVILDWGFWTKESRARARDFYRAKNVDCEFHCINVGDSVWRARIDKRNRAVAAGETTAYFVDDNLARKFASLFEAPAPDEIDVWVNE